MSQPSFLYEAIEAKLGGPGALDDFVALRRTEGASWRTIATEISNRAGRTVNHETLRLWYVGRLRERTVVTVRSAA
jgi:hypothetical protein